MFIKFFSKITITLYFFFLFVCLFSETRQQISVTHYIENKSELTFSIDLNEILLLRENLISNCSLNREHSIPYGYVNEG